MGRLYLLITTLLRLGPKNVIVVVLYRLASRFNFFLKKMPQVKWTPSTIFYIPQNYIPKQFLFSKTVLDHAVDIVDGKVRYFSDRQYHIGSPPDWFLNPVTGKKNSDSQLHWSKLGDFGSGDIKCVWEASRFDWALILARAYRLSGDNYFIETLNDWVSDWIKCNPINTGPNWKCGQEAGIRMMQIMLAAFLLNQHKEPAADLVRFVTEHASRIEPTIRYAIAQDNNHGTSEAAALFIAGAWLSSLQDKSAEQTEKALRWLKLGRSWLENRLEQLVEEDGSFSQYSVNYHRVLLDTICQVEFWRLLTKAKPFSDTFYLKAKAATKWLYLFTNEHTGDAPNMGANDGARLFNLSSVDFRDYRPSVQLACRLFVGTPAYPPGEYDEPLKWLGRPFKDNAYQALAFTKESTVFKQGGYCYLSKKSIEVFIRFPKFRFRPGHADALHLDLWFKGADVIRDGGTYSYNTDEPWQTYFPGTRAHSTVEFDDRDQMPRLSRFLFGSWIKTRSLSPIHVATDKQVWSAGYKDYKGAEHNRKISLSKYSVLITDTVKGFKKRAVIRWRLEPGDWQLDEHRCSSAKCTLAVLANVAVKRFEIIEGYESRYYLSKTPLPVLEIEVDSSAVISTEIVFFK